MVRTIISAKMLIAAIAMFSLSVCAFSQSIDEVTLIVSGDGVTKKEATDVALRSAIEQAFGVFVSANTTILNDSLLKDEIATVSSGNIDRYEEVASLQLPNGNTYVTIKATVSISKLINYATTHGSAVEFAGSTFGANMKLKELNKINEIKSINNMINQIKSLVPLMFDYKLELGEPKVSNNGNYEFNIRVFVIFNSNTETANNILINTLKSLSLTEKEREVYKSLNMEVAELKLGNFMNYNSSYSNTNLANERILKILYQTPFENLGYDGEYLQMASKFLKGQNGQIGELYYFRNYNYDAWKKISDLMFEAIYDFIIQDNLNGKTTIAFPKGCSNCSNSSWDFPESMNNNGLYIKQKKAFIMGQSGYTWYSNIFFFGDGITVPHLFKGLVAQVDGQYIPYIINLTMQIPKEDISKYSKFTIEHKQPSN